MNESYTTHDIAIYYRDEWNNTKPIEWILS